MVLLTKNGDSTALFDLYIAYSRSILTTQKPNKQHTKQTKIIDLD
jgi:hypothetical protein